MGGSGSFLRSSRVEDTSFDTNLQKSNKASRNKNDNLHFNGEKSHKEGNLSPKITRRFSKRYNGEATSTVEEITGVGAANSNFRNSESKSKRVSSDSLILQTNSKKSLNDKTRVNETSIYNISSKLTDDLINDQIQDSVSNSDLVLSSDELNKDADRSESSSPDIILLEDDEAYDMVNGDKDNGFNGFLDDLSTVHKEKSDLVLNGSDSKTTEVEGYYNDPFKSLHLGDNLKNLQKEKRKRGRPPKMNNTRRNALNLSMEAKNTFDEISSLGDSSNDLNESFDDSNNSCQKEKRKRGRPKKNPCPSLNDIHLSPESKQPIDKTTNESNDKNLRTRSSSRTMKTDRNMNNQLPNDLRDQETTERPPSKETDINEHLSINDINGYPIRSRRSLQFDEENTVTSRRLINHGQLSSSKKKLYDNGKSVTPDNDLIISQNAFNGVCVTQNDENERSKLLTTDSNIEECVTDTKNDIPSTLMHSKHAEDDFAMEVNDLQATKTSAFNKVSLTDESLMENTSTIDQEQTKSLPRIVLKMKKCETGDRWLSQPLSKSTKAKHIVKRRSLLRRMKTRFLSKFNNIIFKQDVESHENTLFVGNSIFQEIFSDMTMDIKLLLDSLAIDSDQTKDKQSHLVYKNWNVSHISLQAALRLCTLLNTSSSTELENEASFQTMVPFFVTKALNQLSQMPTVRLKPLMSNEKMIESTKHETLKRKNSEGLININNYTEHDQQLYMDSSNFSNKPTVFKSKRRKQPTAKLIDSDLSFGTNSCLLASFSSEEDLFNNSSGGSNDVSLQNLPKSPSPTGIEKSSSLDSYPNLKQSHQNTGANDAIKQSTPISAIPFNCVTLRGDETKETAPAEISRGRKFEHISVNSMQFIEENAWRFHGKLKPMYRYFSLYDTHQNRTSRNFDLGTASHSVRKLNKWYSSWPCKSNGDADLDSSDDNESEFDENEIGFLSKSASRYDLNSSDELSNDCFPSSKSFNQSKSRKMDSERNLKSPNASPVKSPFKVPQSINIKLKRRRLQDISLSEENSIPGDDEDVSKEDATKKLMFFCKPYEPRTKKVILARASVPKIPKTDSHRISEIIFNTRNRKQEESPCKRKIRPVRKFAMNSSNSLCPTSLKHKKDVSHTIENEKSTELDENTATTTNNTATTTNGEKAVKKVVKNHTIDMPTFTLAGIVENKPRELEGWFTNKIYQLKKLSSEIANNSNSINNLSSSNFNFSHYNNYGNNSSIANGFVSLNKLCQKNRDKKVDKDRINVKVKYSEGAYQIKDLDEYKASLMDKKPTETDNKKEASNTNITKTSKLHELDNVDNCTDDLNIVSLPFNTAKTNLLATNFLKTNGLKSLCLQSPTINPGTTSTNNNGTTPPSNLSELLRVARKIEKISNQGVGRSKGNLRDIPFLPKGWMKVVKRKSFQSDHSPKITIRTCVEYVNNEGKAFDSLTSAIRFISREQIRKRQRSISY